MLMEIFQQHNDQMAALIKVGKDFAPGTLERYNTCRDHIRSFIAWKFGLADIDINRLNFEFASELEFWLKTGRSCAHNTTMKYISNLKKIVNACIRKGWLAKDPFSGFKMDFHQPPENGHPIPNSPTSARPGNWTFHIAGHTFATTVTLSNGVPIESVSKMLGNRSLKTTQHYAKVLDKKVSDDTRLLREKLDESKL